MRNDDACRCGEEVKVEVTPRPVRPRKSLAPTIFYHVMNQRFLHFCLHSYTVHLEAMKLSHEPVFYYFWTFSLLSMIIPLFLYDTLRQGMHLTREMQI